MKPQFQEPKDFEWGAFSNAAGANIRYGRLKPAEGDAKGTLVITTGFRECIEKYFEVVREMSGKGYDVWVMDWRGQGGSERYIKDSQKSHHGGYEEQIETLRRFASEVVEKSSGPLMLLAHSMGAHIGLRCLKEHPGVFDSAMISSPMFDVQTGPLPRPLARQMVKFAKAGNYLDKYIPAGGDWAEDKTPFAGNHLTSDPARFESVQEIYSKNPALRMGDPTYGWVLHTFASIDILNQEDYLKSIGAPVLMQVSDDDRIVMTGAQLRAASLMPNCEKIEIPGAKHEIWMERDELRDVWKMKVEAFMEDRVAKAKAAPDPKKKKPHTKAKPPAP
jgi:lysophospholipase